MLRTWLVRLDAMKFTDSVRSFHVPDTPCTSAWPPSLPSVPTSRATRVTSSAKAESWSTIVFTVVPMVRNSPLSGWPPILSAIFCERSPSATAPITRATSVVGRTRSSMRALSASTLVPHAPPAPASSTRSVMRPSRPMILPTRTSSRDIWSLRSSRPLSASATSVASPLCRGLRREEKSPSRAARNALSRSARSASSNAAPLWRTPSAPSSRIMWSIVLSRYRVPAHARPEPSRGLFKH